MLFGGCALSILAAVLHLLVPVVAGWGKAAVVTSQVVYSLSYGSGQ